MTYEDVLTSLADADERVVVLTAENRAAIRGIPAKLGQRFIDVGICEQTMIGMAAGLALRGRIPVVHALATFLTMRAFEFIRDDVGIPALPVKLVGAVPGFLSDGNGPTHQAIEDIALMRGIPPMQVFCPADRDELLDGFPVIVHDPAPWYVRYNASAPAVHHSPFAIGKAEVLAAGKDVTILTYGFLLAESAAAVDILARKGYAAGLVNMRTLKPADEEVILEAAKRSALLVIVEDHFAAGGLATIVAEVLTKHQVTARTRMLTLGNRWFRPGMLNDVLAAEGFTGPSIADRVLEAL